MFKKAGIFILMIFPLTACRPDGDQIAHDLIMHYCDGHYHHYQPFDFEETQKYYVPYQRTKQYITLNLQQKRLKQQKDSLRRLIAVQNKPAYLLQTSIVDSSLAVISTGMQQAEQKYKPKRHGWMVVHSYNQQPAGGPMVRNTSVFILDDNIKNIVETYDK